MRRRRSDAPRSSPAGGCSTGGPGRPVQGVNYLTRLIVTRPDYLTLKMSRTDPLLDGRGRRPGTAATVLTRASVGRQTSCFVTTRTQTSASSQMKVEGKEPWTSNSCRPARRQSWYAPVRCRPSSSCSAISTHRPTGPGTPCLRDGHGRRRLSNARAADGRARCCPGGLAAVPRRPDLHQRHHAGRRIATHIPQKSSRTIFRTMTLR